MIMCVLLCYPVSFHMLQLLLTGHPICSCNMFTCEPVFGLILAIINKRMENYLSLTLG